MIVFYGGYSFNSFPEEWFTGLLLALISDNATEVTFEYKDKLVRGWALVEGTYFEVMSLPLPQMHRIEKELFNLFRDERQVKDFPFAIPCLLSINNGNLEMKVLLQASAFSLFFLPSKKLSDVASKWLNKYLILGPQHKPVFDST